MAGGAAIIVGVLLVLMGCYLVLGPYASNRSYNMQPGQAEAFELPGWYVFPVGTSILVSWSGLQLSGNVSLTTCQSISSSGACVGAGPVLQYGTGSSGSFTFVASGGQLYGISSNSLGIVTTSAEYSSAYGAILFLVFTLGIVAIAMGYMHHVRGGTSRYRPI